MLNTSLYNLRRNDTLEKPYVRSVYHGTESLSFLGPKVWDLVPVELKLWESLNSFKLKLKNWVPFENAHADYVKLPTTRIRISLRQYDHFSSLLLLLSFLSFALLLLYMYVYIYIITYICVRVYIYIYNDKYNCLCKYMIRLNLQNKLWKI